MGKHREEVARVSIADLAGGPVTLRVTCRPTDIELSDAEFTFPDPVMAEVRFELAGSEVRASGWAETVAVGCCVRCLGEARMTLRGRMEVLFEHNPDLLKPQVRNLGTEDGSIVYFDGESVCADGEMREALLIELPPLPLCRADCLGLCPRCGADLNAGPCGCPPDDGGGWKAALRQIKIE
jgi:uncharacterized protein